MKPETSLLDRFRADLDALAPDGRLGVAVSGGPDSLALLLLAAATRPGTVEAATVDHGLRPESADEAAYVGSVAERLGVPHTVLRGTVAPGASLQAQARALRYRLLGDWAIGRGLNAVATAHHADDQAETLLMRLARGAGVSGLAATRRRRPLEKDIDLVRPLLDWRKAELAGIVADAGLIPVDDPANRDPRHDRTRFRRLLERTEWAEPERLALSAKWLADADEALDWALAGQAAERITEEGSGLLLDPAGLPRELQRRLLLTAFDRLGVPRPRGPDLDRARKALRDGRRTTLSGLKLTGGERWLLEPEQARRG